MAQFDASLFLRKHATSAKTTVKAHGHKVAMVGAPKDYTLEGFVGLAKRQLDDVKISTPKIETAEGLEGSTRFTVPPALTVLFLQGKNAKEPAQSASEDRANAEPATMNGHVPV